MCHRARISPAHVFLVPRAKHFHSAFFMIYRSSNRKHSQRKIPQIKQEINWYCFFAFFLARNTKRLRSRKRNFSSKKCFTGFFSLSFAPRGFPSFSDRKGDREEKIFLGNFQRIIFQGESYIDQWRSTRTCQLLQLMTESHSFLKFRFSGEKSICIKWKWA